MLDFGESPSMSTISEVQTQCPALAASMVLRPPVAEALGRFCELVDSVGPKGLNQDPSDIVKIIKKICAMTGSPLAEKLSADVAELTFDLATGVGKTRLAAAFIAALLRSGRSRSFLIVAPRRTVRDKFAREFLQTSDRYLFQGVDGLPPIDILTAENFDRQAPLFDQDSAQIAITTAQWLSRGDGSSRRCDVTGMTPIERLRSRGPLVLIIDESHHFDATIWAQIPRQVGASIVLKLTATPTPREAVLYSYPLGKCLREGVYTKRPTLEIQKLTAGTTVEQADRMVLRDALATAARLAPQLEGYANRTGKKSVNPVILVAAKDILHAEAIGKMLHTDFGLPQKSVLVIHSKQVSDDAMDELLNIEASESPVRVVVQVFSLEEGWDVSNVYVIAPLREMASYRGIRQLMGRGLRLPFGVRTGIEEIDALTILVYGRSSVAQLVTAAIADLGNNAVSIRGPLDPSLPNGTDTLRTRLADVQAPYAETRFPWIETDIVPQVGHPNFSALTLIDDCHSEGRFDLQTLELLPRVGLDDLSDHDWALVVSLYLVRSDRRLSAGLHGPLIRDALLGRLNESHSPLRRDGRRVAIESAVQSAFDECGSTWRSLPAEYETVGHTTQRSFSPREYVLRSEQPEPISPAAGEVLVKAGIRSPIAGFTKSVMTVGLYDSAAEVRFARTIDQLPTVKWWLRNDPRQVLVPTTDVADTAPDFLICVEKEGRLSYLLVEVKGRNLWEPAGSTAQRQARDLTAWALRVSSQCEFDISVLFVAHDDVANFTTVEKLLQLRLVPD